jgi:hypothetical protein
MGTAARRTATILAVCGAAASAAGIASAHGWTRPVPTQDRQHAVLNGVMDVKKSKLGRFNFRFHVSQYGVITGHGEYNGGGQNYISLASISSLSCSDHHLSVSGIGTLLNGTSVPFSITAVDGGPGEQNAADQFSISFGSYSRSGPPVAGKIYFLNCSTDA